MNMLINELPKEVNGLKLNTDFRVSILFELLMQDPNISNSLKIIKALQLYYVNIEQITDCNKAIEGMLWFYGCGKASINSTKESTNQGKTNKIYSYEFDDSYIYSAFYQQYNIDLQEIKYMHWWQFKALFDGLNEDTQIVKIMGYRAVNLSTIKDTERKNYYKKMKKLYALPDMRTQEEKETEFAKAFL